MPSASFMSGDTLLGGPTRWKPGAVVEGSLGAFGSIVVANLAPDPNDMPEVYIAGSSGIRRFDFQ